MKRFIGILTALLVVTSVYAQNTTKDKAVKTFDKILDFTNQQIDTLTSSTEMLPPEYFEEEPYVEPEPQYVTKEQIIADMNTMWNTLFDEENTIVAMPDNVDSIRYNYTGDKVYVMFEDDMFSNDNRIAYYADITDSRFFPSKNGIGNERFPVIVFREKALKLTYLEYKMYMRDVVAHELLHYALDIYTDYDGTYKTHDERFEMYANGFNETLGTNIKCYATAEEVCTLVY